MTAPDEEVICESCHGMGSIDQMLDDHWWTEECKTCGGEGLGIMRTVSGLEREKTMDHKQYRAALERMGLTQTGAATCLGIDARTSRRYALGECPVPLTVEKLLGYMEGIHGSVERAKAKRPLRKT